MSTNIPGLISSLIGFQGMLFDPRAMLRVANPLIELGPREAPALLLGLAGSREVAAENLLLTARIFFVAREGRRLPPLELGRPEPEPNADLASLPLFPLHLERDLPLLLVSGYAAGGESLPPSAYIERCIRDCSPRLARLRPPDDPLGAVDAFLQSPTWRSACPEPWCDGMLRLQATRALSGAADKPSPDELLDPLRGLDAWERYRRDIATLGTRWDPERDEYALGGAGG